MIANKKQTRALITEALRHVPERYGLQMSPNGFVDLGELVAGLNRYDSLQHDPDVVRAVVGGQSFEVLGAKVRAVAGHTTECVVYDEKEPPPCLYYPTLTRNKGDIEGAGITAKREKWVPLSITREEAAKEAKRRRMGNNYLLVQVRARDAWEEGVPFYTFCLKWYVQSVPPLFCDIEGS